VEQRVLQELEAAGVPVGGAPADVAAALLKPETTKQLPYFQAVVNESLRLHPAAAPASNR
jgi:cytochrome P450